MKMSKQEIINKVLSFNSEELPRWIKSRLYGDDRYFPIYEGYETNLSEFLEETYKNIKEEGFRESFISILESLTVELENFSICQIEKDKEYIYELLSLCGVIRHFKRKDSLYRLACSGRIKNVFAFDLELHQLLLTVMTSPPAAGNLEFWVEQMKDDSNKYYANAAFYAFLGGFEPGILFDHMGIFIDRFKEDSPIIIEMGITAMLHDYGKAATFQRFKGIEKNLSDEQRKAINEAVHELGYDRIFIFGV